MIQFDSYFSTGLVQPPTRNPCFLGMKTQAPPEKNRQAEAEAAEDLAARLAATEESRRQERLRAAEELAKAADTSTGGAAVWGDENDGTDGIGVRMRWIFFGGGFVGIGYHDKVVEGHYQKLLSLKRESVN